MDILRTRKVVDGAEGYRWKTEPGLLSATWYVHSVYFLRSNILTPCLGIVRFSLAHYTTTTSNEPLPYPLTKVKSHHAGLVNTSLVIDSRSRSPSHTCCGVPGPANITTAHETSSLAIQKPHLPDTSSPRTEWDRFPSWA